LIFTRQAKAALDRASAQCGTAIIIGATKIDAFARLMSEKLDSGTPTPANPTSAPSSTPLKSTPGRQDYWQQGRTVGCNRRQTDRKR
jgi:hypothetical protein